MYIHNKKKKFKLFSCFYSDGSLVETTGGFKVVLGFIVMLNNKENFLKWGKKILDKMLNCVVAECQE